MRELCELLENITEEGYTVLFGQYDGSDELYIRISKKGGSINNIIKILEWAKKGCPGDGPEQALRGEK